MPPVLGSPAWWAWYNDVTDSTNPLMGAYLDGLNDGMRYLMANPEFVTECAKKAVTGPTKIGVGELVFSASGIVVGIIVEMRIQGTIDGDAFVEMRVRNQGVANISY